MKKHKITFENRYTFHQKTMLIGFSVISFLFCFNSIKENIYISGHLITLLFLLLTIFLIALSFSQKGLMKKNAKLYKTISFKGIILFKNRIEVLDRPVVSILTFRKKQKFSFVSSANPDQSESFNAFEIFALNDRHTKRETIIYFKSKENANKAIEFLIQNFLFRHEEFSPDFS